MLTIPKIAEIVRKIKKHVTGITTKILTICSGRLSTTPHLRNEIRPKSANSAISNSKMKKANIGVSDW